MAEGRGRRAVRIAARAASQEAGRSLSRAVRRTSPEPGADHAAERARQFRRTLEELGPFYIKIGQILATRPDFVPDHVREELSLLNDQAVARPFAAFAPVLERELGPGWRDRFASVRTEEPLGSASLAQVYRATLRDGTDCVIKVQRPDADRAVLGDMRALGRVARLTARFTPRFNAVIDMGGMLEVLFDAMRDELDFTREASHMKAGRKLARDYKYISVPKVLHATPKVLIQSLADGVAINRVKEDAFTEKQRKKTANQLIEFMFRSYFTTGRFHADPHPGNVLIGSDGTAHIIDWGMVGRLDRGARLAVLGLFVALARNDGESFARQWIRLGSLTPWSDVPGFIQDLSRKIPRWSNATLAELNYGVALMSVLRYSTHRGIHVAPIVSVIGKSVANMEGSVRCLYSKAKLRDTLRGTLDTIVRDQLRSELDAEQLGAHLLNLLTLTDKSAAQVHTILSELASRQFTIQTRTNLGDPIAYGRKHRR
ncbi:AarF/UbiB family protein [Streptomyces sp. LP05-1]|uniref:AarF/UbiB family protein n=1 Tax=Streptomyces pyxinae TaxID=2970734 RepID=A0ABT2CED0_9ACTN|nr:AarF/UbiB family protein [Streptomyces sp. LP05-1]MCS0635771.1 AarF/UbiB family protein [Streptomyces sp. LP05-1]